MLWGSRLKRLAGVNWQSLAAPFTRSQRPNMGQEPHEVVSNPIPIGTSAYTSAWLAPIPDTAILPRVPYQSLFLLRMKTPETN
jgi:hypothetical protein